MNVELKILDERLRDRLPAYLRVLGVFAQSLHKGRAELQVNLVLSANQAGLGKSM